MSSISREVLSHFSMGGRLGIDELPACLRENETYHVHGISGHMYNFTANSRLVSIQMVNNLNVKVRAQVSTEGLIEWRLYTRWRDEIVDNNDLFAHTFYDAAMAYFLAQGTEVNSLYAVFNSGTTNHTQFRKGISNHLKPEDAYFKTWSGLKAQEHGFRDFSALSDTGLNELTYRFLVKR